jgi:hypothetical protein
MRRGIPFSLILKVKPQQAIRFLILASVCVSNAVSMDDAFAQAGSRTPQGVSSGFSTQDSSPKGGGESVKISVDARGRKVQHVDFSDSIIEGTVRTPDGFLIQSRNAGRFNSLVELRSHFREKINIHSVEASSNFGLSE